VSVDCGITAVDEVEYARAQGIDVVITDHHRPGELPDALAVINPKRTDCPYPYKDLSGVALAFKLADAVYRAGGIDTDFVYSHLDLVALGCAADIVPLTGENRIMVAAGLAQMHRTENLGLQALLRNVDLAGRRLGTGQLVFVLAPRINAVGRIGSALEAVTLLTTDDTGEAEEIARSLERQNQRRRQIDARMYAEAVEMVGEQADVERDSAIVLASESWHPGVIGIVASRIAEEVHLPTVLVSLDGERSKGSGRSIPGFDLYAALSRCRQHLAGFGGHKYAAGMTLHRDRFGAFRDAFLESAGEILHPEDRVPRLFIDEEITLGRIDGRLLASLRRLAPFGPQNTRPVLASRGVDVVGAPAVVGRGHIKFRARQNGRVLDCMGYNLGHLIYRLTPGEANLDMAYVIEETEWRGRAGLQLRIRDLR